MLTAKLLALLEDQTVTDVVVNGPEDLRVQAGGGWRKVAIGNFGSAELASLAIGWIAKGNRHLDLANPMADVSLSAAELPELANLGLATLRVHAVLGGALSDTTFLSLRAHRVARLSQNLAQVVAGFEASPETSGRLAQLAASGDSFLISGTPGSGKTTLLRAMLAHQPDLRTLVLEDTAELLPIDGHFVGLQVREANIELQGEIGYGRLLREALRMSPQRIVLGEVRGAEAAVLLEAMNLTGIGGACTIHSRSAEQVGARLVGLTGIANALDSFDWLIHLGAANGVRAIESIAPAKRLKVSS